MQRNGVLYTILFAAAVCGICSILVSGAAVGLRGFQKANVILEKQRNVLAACGLIEAGERLSGDEVRQRFEDNIVAKIVTLKTGEYDDSIDTAAFDQRRAAKDPATSERAPDNEAGILNLPKNALVYLMIKDGAPDALVLPISGRGLWSTLYGYLALDKDTTTVRGITFYEHGETPGLGGEIDNPRWKALWVGRKAYDAQWLPQLSVIKGQAGAPDRDPGNVDGLSGATLTSRGVEKLVRFWLGSDGLGTYLKKFRETGS